MEYISILSQTENRTELTRELQHVKETDPYSPASYVIRFQENMKSEQYDAAEKEASEYERTYGFDENLYEDYIKLYIAQEKLKEAVTTIQDASEAYPNSAYFNEMMHNIALRLRKDPQGANRINEQFLKRNFGIPTARQLIQEYFEIGQNDKALRMLLDLNEQFPGNVIYLEQLYNYYYSKKDNKKAGQYVAMLLAQAPFHAAYHEYAARLHEQSGNNESALASFQKVLKYNPNDFDVRRRIRELENRTNLNTLLPQNDPYELIKKSKLQDKSREFDWYYILDERATILYPEGCSETYYTIVLKVLNEKGIDDWKEATLGYNQYRQRLIVEKAEVVKPGGSKFSAEQNGNELVFTNLEKGDAVYLRYRIVSYAYGRMAREFWDSYAFNAFVPTGISRYVLLCPKNLDFDSKIVHTELKPAVQEVEDFKVYTWETLNEPALKEESFMPPRFDVSRSLNVSTLHDWKEVADWYSDLSTLQSKQDQEVQQAVKNLFPQGKTFSPEEKARSIYEFILKNIRYSSVSFRQSAFMPQKASSVLQTKLGDCKDLSTLYAAMAREAGLEANLVLLNTRDNGEESLNLPSVDFNHCIVKVKAGSQVWHLELTDSNLPFGSLPNGDIGGLALEIPYNGTGAATGIFKLNPKNRSVDYRHQQVQIDIKNRDLSIINHATLGGAISRNLRDDYANLSKEEQLENMQRLIG
jgi:transglutaminase-like putative cysteine protease